MFCVYRTFNGGLLSLSLSSLSLFLIKPKMFVTSVNITQFGLFVYQFCLNNFKYQQHIFMKSELIISYQVYFYSTGMSEIFLFFAKL